jgi:hypothetical protein
VKKGRFVLPLGSPDIGISMANVDFLICLELLWEREAKYCHSTSWAAL